MMGGDSVVRASECEENVVRSGQSLVNEGVKTGWDRMHCWSLTPCLHVTLGGKVHFPLHRRRPVFLEVMSQ